MKKTALLLGAILALQVCHGQDGKTKEESAGEFELGMRSTYSLFSHDGYFGEGVGGQFRIRLGANVNTGWFADLITTNIGDLGKRTTGHIGWSVMFYPFDTYGSKFEPYLIGGHCFDYTKVEKFSTIYNDNTDEVAERWSSAVQMGLGTHWNVAERLDFSLNAQYMMHLGTEIHAEIEDHHGLEELHIHESTESLGLEGHLLVSLSVNVLIADLW